MKIGKTIGVHHGYIQDGIWIRCDCGNEMLEILQIPANANKDNIIEYQFRSFGPIGGTWRTLTDNDIFWSCFVTHKVEIQRIVDFYSSANYGKQDKEQLLELFDKESGFKLQCVVDFPYNDIILYNTEGAIIWDIVIDNRDVSELIRSLETMLNNDNSEANNG